MKTSILIDFSNTVSTTESENEALEIFLEYIRRKYHIAEQILDKFVNIRHQKLIERENNFKTFMEINAEILKENFGIQFSYDDIEYYYNIHCKNLKLREGYNEFIKFIKSRRINIVMVTDADFEYTIRTTSALKILDDFDYIITAEDVRSPKPNAQIFIKALLLADCPEKAFFIGDSDRRDIMGAKSIWLGTIRIKDYISEKKETSADHEARNFYEVINIIESELR